MKNKTPFLLLFLLFTCYLNSQAQSSCTNQRYIVDNFSITTIEEVNFGTAPAVNPLLNYSQTNTSPQALDMDIYLPVGDPLIKRPAIIMAFGGAFITGLKEFPQLVSVCQAWARKGFVVASIDYRIGFSAASLQSQAQAIRATYRGAQDFRAAVRFLRHHAATYNVDPDLIFGGGHSAGSISSMNATYPTEANRTNPGILAPTYTYNAGFFEGTWPDLACFDCEGNTLANAPNFVDSELKVIINLWGAIADLSWINAGEAAMVSFHGDADVVVDINTGSPFGTLGGGVVFPPIHGSIPIHQRLESLGIENELHVFAGQPHEPWVSPAILQYIIDSTAAFLVDYMKPATPVISGHAAVSEGDVENYSVPANSNVSYCWEVINGTIIAENNEQITVQWDMGEAEGTVINRIIEEHIVESDPAVFGVTITTVTVTPPQRAYATVFLEGAYVGGNTPLQNMLRTNNVLPIEQPYDNEPWEYNGSESVAMLADIPPNVVDWVLVELGANDNPALIVERAAAFLLTDGTLQGVDGLAGIPFSTLINPNNYYLTIRHRNHLAVTTSGAIALPNANNTAYDFTTANTQVIGTDQMKAVTAGVFALRSGDIDGNGVINVEDFNGYVEEIGTSGYLLSDCNLDRNNTLMDFNLYKPNASIIGINSIRY